jgi:hypothetical protein
MLSGSCTLLIVFDEGNESKMNRKPSGGPRADEATERCFKTRQFVRIFSCPKCAATVVPCRQTVSLKISIAWWWHARQSFQKETQKVCASVQWPKCSAGVLQTITHKIAIDWFEEETVCVVFFFSCRKYLLLLVLVRLSDKTSPSPAAVTSERNVKKRRFARVLFCAKSQMVVLLFVVGGRQTFHPWWNERQSLQEETVCVYVFFLMS